MQNYSFIYAIKYSKPVYYKIIYLVEQHPAFGFDLHNLHHSVEHVVFHALDDVLGLLGGLNPSASNAAFILARTWANCPYFIPMLDIRADEVYCRLRYFSHSSCLMVKPVTTFMFAFPVRTPGIDGTVVLLS